MEEVQQHVADTNDSLGQKQVYVEVRVKVKGLISAEVADLFLLENVHRVQALVSCAQDLGRLGHLSIHLTHAHFQLRLTPDRLL